MTADTYRVIYTGTDGFTIPVVSRQTRDEALAYFDGVLAGTSRFPASARLRVMSEQEWRRVLGGAR